MSHNLFLKSEFNNTPSQLTSLIQLYNPKDKRLPSKWLSKIGVFYHPFIEQIYTNPEGKQLATKRYIALFKFWAANNITTLEDAYDTIPLCDYCKTERCIIHVNQSHMTKACHQKDCKKKYVYDQTKKSVQEKYGVDNISSVDSIKKLKSKIQKRNHAIRGNEITAKRKNTVQEKYGVNNISQLNEVKEKKAGTFTEHYGVDNIFKRSDLMKKIWLESIGADNPKHASEFNIKRIKRSIIGQINDRGFWVKRGTKEYGFLHPSEEVVFDLINEKIRLEYISSNDTIIEKVIDGKSNASLVDIHVRDIAYIEVKNDLHYYDQSLVRTSFNLANLVGNQIIMITITHKDNYSYLMIDSNNIKSCYHYNLNYSKIKELYGVVDYNIKLESEEDVDKSFVDNILKRCPKNYIKKVDTINVLNFSI